MQTSKSFGIHFTLRTDKAKDGKFPIFACITVNRQRAFISLKQYIHPDRWDTRKSTVKGAGSEMKAISNHMEEIRHALTTHYKQLEVKGHLITASKIKSLYLGEEDQVYTLSRLCAYHNETAAGAIKDSTMKHYHVTQRYLVRFLKDKHQKTDIYLHELDHKFLMDFEVFLRNYKPTDHQKAIKHNGIMKHVVRLKKMIHIAVDLNWIGKDPFASFRVRTHKVNRTQLNAGELAEISKKELAIERLDAVRDMFVFACYTGLSYIDISKLTPAHIESDGDDIWIRTQREKTQIPVDIPLLPQALVILKKYKPSELKLFPKNYTGEKDSIPVIRVSNSSRQGFIIYPSIKTRDTILVRIAAMAPDTLTFKLSQPADACHPWDISEVTFKGRPVAREDLYVLKK